MKNNGKVNIHGKEYSTVAYRKGLTMNVRYESGEYAKLGIDDWKFIWDAHLKGYKFAYSKSPLCYYRAVDDSISFTRDEKEVLRVKDDYLAKI